MSGKRVKTGVPGMGGLIQGGFSKGSVNLISGAPGTGKSIFSLQFIHNGAKNGEPGLYITFEQPKEDVISNGKKIGLDLEPLVKKNKLKIFHVNPGTLEQSMLNPSDFINMIKDEIKELEAKRLVIDSLSSLINVLTLGYMGEKTESSVIEIGDTKLIPLVINEKPIIRTIIWNIINGLKETKCTSLITSEMASESRWLSRDTISEFVVDSVITLHYLGIGAKGFRSLKVVKMRETKHEEDFIPFEISKNGIEIKEKQKFKA